MTFFLAAVTLMLLSSLLSVFVRCDSPFLEKCSLGCLLVGTGLGITAVFQALAVPGGLSIALPWPIPGGEFSLAIDGLSAIFLLPAFLLIGAGAIYGIGYLPQKENPGTGSWVRCFYALLAAGIVMVLAANNGILFLFSWESMALAGYFLVCTERNSEEAQSAGFLYLICTHTGTLVLFALFALLISLTGISGLPAVASLDGSLGSGTAIFLLALFGFGLKAGIMPLHIWLPPAHAAAPSHVSALMSGVMIKTGIYGIARTATFFHSIPAWWGWTILGLGVVSGILGVVLAIAQHDIKRLLAYHSVENIGIILLGLGTALLGSAYNEPTLIGLGLAGGLLHVINHGLFKGLLFLSAGSMIHATGTRNLLHYGGMLRTMPFTGIFFLAGAVAICGLPPLNGFVSEWFVYLGLLHAGGNASQSLSLAVLAAPALAMIGGLALLCFAKVFGLSFLGTPPEQPPTNLHEAPPSMLTGMAILLAACLWIGLLPATMVPLLSKGLIVWPSATTLGQEFSLATLAPVGAISLSAMLLVLLLSAVLFFVKAINRNRTAATGPTWGCGYSFGTSRMQYTVSSFAEIIANLFDWVHWTKTGGEKPQGLFPGPSSLSTHTPDVVLDLVVLPFCRICTKFTNQIRHLFHHGILNLYLLNIVITIALLVWYAIL